MHLEQKNPSRLKRQKKVGNSIMPPKRKLRILISNDDGIGSQGIMALGRALSRIAQVTMVAPEREQSTMGHALTLHKPVRIFHVGSEKNLDMWATSGTPADCVYVGLRYVMKHKPDIIVSGINRGVNLGNDAYYSGTIAAAREGAVMDIPAIAASLDYHYEPGKKGSYSFDWAADYIVELVKNLVENPIPPSCLLNINFPNVPAGKVKGVRVARQGFRIYTDKVEARHDFRGKKYFWLGGKYAGFKQIEGSDCEVLDQNFISITPFRIDLTQYDYMETLASWVPDPHQKGSAGTAKVAVPISHRGLQSRRPRVAARAAALKPAAVAKADSEAGSKAGSKAGARVQKATSKKSKTKSGASKAVNKAVKRSSPKTSARKKSSTRKKK